MADTSSHSQPAIPQLVEEYMAIVKRHGVGSTDARKFRHEHPNCPGLDDVEAAYRAAEKAALRRRSRGCLLSLIAVFVTCIAVYGVVFASRAGLLNKKVAEVSIDKAAVEQELGETTTKLEGTKKVLTKTKDQLGNTARQRDAAKNLRDEFDKINRAFGAASDTQLPASTSTATVTLKVAAPNNATEPVEIAFAESDSGSQVTQNDEAIDRITIESAKESKEVELRITELRPNEVRTVVVAASSGTVSPSAMTVIADELTNEPKPIELHLVTPSPSPDGVTVNLGSADPDVAIFVDGEPANQVVVPPGQTAVRFSASSGKAQAGGVSHIIATVDGASPFLVRAKPATSLTPAKVITEVTGIPKKAIGGAAPIAVTVNLTNSSPAAKQVKLISTNPNVSFRSADEEGAILTVTADGSECPFEIVTMPVTAHEVAEVTINYGNEQKHVAFLLAPTPKPTPAFGAIELPSKPLSSGEKLKLSIPVGMSFTAEDIKLVKVDGEGIQFSAPEFDDNGLTIEGTIQTVNEVKILPVTVSLGDYKVSANVTVKPAIVAPDKIILPRELAGLPTAITSGGEASTVAIKLPVPVTDPKGVAFSLSSSNPNVVFRSGDHPISHVTALPSDDHLRFEIAANGIKQTEAVCITISQGNQQTTTALLVTAQQSELVDALALPNKPVVSGGTFVASIKVPAELTDEQLDGIQLTTDGQDAQVVRQVGGANAEQVDFEVTAPSVTEPQLLHVSASVGDPSRPVVSTKPIMIVPKAALRSSLVSVEVDPETGGGTVTLDREATDYRQVVSLESSSSTVMLPDFVIIEAGEKSATFEVAPTPSSPESEVSITATLETQKQQAKFTVRPTAPRPTTVERTNTYQTATTHRCSRRIKRVRRR